MQYRGLGITKVSLVSIRLLIRQIRETNKDGKQQAVQ